MFQRNISIRLTSASAESILSTIVQRGIAVRKVIWINELTVEAIVSANDLTEIERVASNRGDDLKIVGQSGGSWFLDALKKRPVFLFGVLFFLILTICIPNIVLFVSVEGNDRVSDYEVLQAAADNGVYFGANRRKIRSEALKNDLLEQIPQLQWAGINTHGCVAVITVKEKENVNESEIDLSFCNIVARCNGVIRQMAVQSGTPVCSVGQAVEKGQLLVSGYTDCGLKVQTTAAKAEIYADTVRSLESITLSESTQRTRESGRSVRYSLILGKKLIKFYNSSSISHSSCVTILDKKILTLPGGFSLPVSLLAEEITHYETEPRSKTDALDFTWLYDESEHYLQNEILVGSIVSADYKHKFSTDSFLLQGNFVCFEMIGKVSDKEILTKDE